MPSAATVAVAVVGVVAVALSIAGLTVTGIMLTGFGDPDVPPPSVSVMDKFPEHCDADQRVPIERDQVPGGPCCTADERGLFWEPNATCDARFAMKGAQDTVQVDATGIEKSAMALMKVEIGKSLDQVVVSQAEMLDYIVLLKADIDEYSSSLPDGISFSDSSIIYVQGGVPLGEPGARQRLAEIPLKVDKVTEGASKGGDVEISNKEADGSYMKTNIAAVLAGGVGINVAWSAFGGAGAINTACLAAGFLDPELSACCTELTLAGDPLVADVSFSVIIQALSARRSNPPAGFCSRRGWARCEPYP